MAKLLLYYSTLFGVVCRAAMVRIIHPVTLVIVMIIMAYNSVEFPEFENFSHLSILLHAEWDNIPIPFTEMCLPGNHSEIACLQSILLVMGKISGSIPDLVTF